jgi:hypothetical protein
MKLPIGTAHLASLCLLALALALALSAALRPSSRHKVPAPGWRLAEFIDHLRAQGIQFRVIPDRPDGPCCNAAFLTEDPDETWLSCQKKSKTVERIVQWRGSIWVKRIDRYTDTEGLLWQWGEYGCRIGNFLLFGDKQIVDRIRRAFHLG